MEEILNKIKKVNISTLLILIFLVIIIFISLTSGTNNKKQKKIVAFNFSKSDSNDLYPIINALQSKMAQLEKELNNKKNLHISTINPVEKTLEDIDAKHGGIVNKKVLADGSILITDKDGNKYLIHPDGSIEKIKNYKVNTDGTVTITDNNGKIFNKKSNFFNKNKIKKQKIVTTAFGNIKKINNNIKSFVDKNGNKYIKDKNGNWIMIKPDGTKIKLGKKLSFDKDGNIIFNGKKLGQLYSINKKNNVMFDKEGNSYKEVPEVTTGTKELSSSEKTLEDITAKHGGIVDKKVLADGSILITTKDGKKILIHPDGSIEPVKDYKVNPDGTVNIIKDYQKVKEQLSNKDFSISNIINKNGKLIEVDIDKNFNLLLESINNKKFYLNKNNILKVNSYIKDSLNKVIKVKSNIKNIEMFYGVQNIKLSQYVLNENGIIDFHELKNHSILFTTGKINKYLITKNGYIKYVKDYKVNPDGTIDITFNLLKVSKLSSSFKTLQDLLKNGENIMDKKVLADGSILITDKNGKKYLIHPDGSIESIKDYKVNPDGTVIITDKNGNILGNNFLKKIFVDKNGRKYLIDNNGKKHDIKDGYIDKNGRLVYIDKTGKKHVLKSTGKTLLLKTTPNGKKIVLGQGKIVNINGQKKLIFDKIFNNKLGYPIEYFITNNNDEYNIKNNDVYLNEKLLGKGTINLKNGKFIVNTNNGQPFIFNSIDVKSYLVKSLYFVSKNNKEIYKVQKNKLWIMKHNGEIKEFNNISFYLHNQKLSVKFFNTSKEQNFNVKKIKIFPLFSNSNIKLINLPYSYYVIDNSKLVFKFFTENINLKLKKEKIYLINNFSNKILGNLNEQINGKISSDFKNLIYNNKFYHNSLVSKFNDKIKNLDMVNGYKINDIPYLLKNKNLFQVGKNSYFFIPDVIFTNFNNKILIKNKFKKIIVDKINLITPLIYLKDKGVIIKKDGYNYLLNDKNIKFLGKGLVNIRKRTVFLNGKFVGNIDNNNFDIKNGIIIKPRINNSKINEINKLNNILNRYFSTVDYGVKIFLNNGGMVFYNDKLEVINVTSDSTVQNLGKGKILLNKQNKKIYFINISGTYQNLGTMKNRTIENNLLIITNKGKFYINNSKIFKILNNKTLNNLMLLPDIENEKLFGYNTKNIFDFGEILQVYKANLINNKVHILNNGVDYNKFSKTQMYGENKTQHLSKKLVIKNGVVFKVQNGKEIEIGKLDSIGKKLLIINDKNSNKKIVLDKNGNKYSFIKNRKGKIIVKKNGKKVKSNFIKIKNGKVFINGKEVKDLKFINEYRNKNNTQVKLLNPTEFTNLFDQELKKKKQIIESKFKKNYNYNRKNVNSNSNLNNNINSSSYRYEVITSNTAIKRNKTLFLDTTNKPIEKTVYINSDTGEISNNLSGVSKNNYFLIPGIKIPVVLAGGSLAPLQQLKQTSSGGLVGGGGSSNPVGEYIPNSFFVIKKNITLPSGRTIPMNKGIIVATPIPTTAQRMFYKCKAIYFYDENNDKWYKGNANGQVVSSLDNVPGLPGILIDTRNKYIAKAAIYSILQGISKFINNVHSPLDAIQNASGGMGQMSPPSVGGSLSNSVMGGASEQLKNLSNVFMAIIRSQVPYLAVQNGEKGNFITDDVIKFTPLELN